MAPPAVLRRVAAAPPAVLGRPAFRRLWTAGVVTDAGDWLLFIALPIVVYRLTGSVLGTSFAFLAQLAPGIALAPLGGWLADRLDRRALLLGLTALQALSLTPLLFVFAHSSLVVLYGVIVAQSALQSLFDPTEQALVPALVGPGELVSANALVGLGQGVARLAGGPLGGVLLALAGLRAVAIVDLASYLAAAILIARVPTRAGATPARAPAGASTPGPSPVAGAGPAGFWAVLRIPRVRAAVVLSGFADISQGIFLVLFVVFVARRLHGGAGETGLLRGVQAVGAIGAGTALAVIARAGSPARLMAGAALAFGVISLLIWNLPAVSTAPWLYGVLFAAAGAPAVVMVTGMVSYLQQSGEDRERGRIFAALGLADNLGEAIGMALAGALTATVGLGAMLDLEGGLYLAVGLAATRWLARADTGGASVARAARAARAARLPNASMRNIVSRYERRGAADRHRRARDADRADRGRPAAAGLAADPPDHPPHGW